VVIVRLHSNAARLSAGAVRYLKVKIEADGFRILFDHSVIAAHLPAMVCRPSEANAGGIGSVETAGHQEQDETIYENLAIRRYISY
jgi:hypothetical protein